MSLKFLILGGSSYLGRELVKLLEGQGHTVSAVVRSETAATKIRQISKTTSIIFDHEAITSDQDFLLNLIVDYGRKGESLSQLLEANLLYPLRLIEKSSFKTLINFSTALHKNVSNYSLSKTLLEDSLKQLQDEKGFRFLNLKLQHFYGANAPADNFVTFLVNQLKENNELNLTDCEQQRDFIHIDDLLNAIDLIIKKEDKFAQFSNIEIGSGKAIKLKIIVELLRERISSSSKINYGARPRRKKEPDQLVADTSLLQSLGWRTNVPFEDGVNDLINGSRG
jgi:CDP-paratose synthetase